VFRENVGEVPCNLVSIFGAARQGKSFMMNMLSGQEDLFRVSNRSVPCTQGVDICSKVMPLHEFASTDIAEATNAAQSCTGDVDKYKESKVVVGFVDAEGQGDRDVTYDARLICPVLLTSKTVLFNWKNR
jgi:hypothetical protein